MLEVISQEKKSQYWNHFTDEAQRSFRPKKITDIRLKQIKEIVLSDDFLWQEIILRHDAPGRSPEELKEMSPPAYELARSKFWAMIRAEIQHQLTKSTR